jgi:hypothetical protein
MKTKNEIANEIWNHAKKSFWFYTISGIVLPLVLFFFPTKVHINLSVVEMLLWCTGLSVMFIVYGIMELSEHRKKSMRKIYDIMIDPKNSSEFMYKSVFGKTTRGESILVGILTKAYGEFTKGMEKNFGCEIFGPVIFAVAGIFLVSNLDTTLWLHVNPYLVIILFATYLYLGFRIRREYYKIWKEAFRFTSCEVKLAFHSEMPLEFVLPKDENEEEFKKKVIKDCIEDFARQKEEKNK